MGLTSVLPGLAGLPCGGAVVYAVIGRNAWYFQMLARGATRRGRRERNRRSAARNSFRPAISWTAFSCSARNWKTWALVGDLLHDLRRVHRHDRLAPRILDLLLFGHTRPRGDACRRLLDRHLHRPSGRRYVSDRIGGEGTGRLGLGIMLLGAILMTSSGDFFFSVAAEILMATGMGVANAAVFKLVAQEIPEAVGGRRRVGGRARRVRGVRHPAAHGGHRAGRRGSKGTRTGSWSSSVWRWSPFCSSGSSNGNAPRFPRPQFDGFPPRGFLRR